MNDPRKLVLPFIALFALAAIATGAINGAPPAKKTTKSTSQTAFRNVQVFDGTKIIPRTTVVVDGSKIVAVGVDAKIPAGARVIEGKGKTLMPGLIDSHTHSFGNALERALQFGVTTQLDMFTAVPLMTAAKKEQSEGKATGRADLVSSGTLLTAPGGHGSQYFPIDTIKSASDVPAFVKARVAEGSDFIKVVYEDGSAYGISFPSLDLASVKAAIEAGHAHDKMVVVHVSKLERAREVILAGADGLVHTFADAEADDEVVALAKKNGTFIVPTLTVIEGTSGIASGASLAKDARFTEYLTPEETANLASAFPASPRASRNMPNAFQTVKAFSSSGIPILAGSDAPNPGTAYGASMHRELELLVLSGLTPVEALTAATSAPATMFKLRDRGRIAPGLRADLLLVSGDPASEITDSRNIEGIWKEGVEVERVKPVKTGTVVADVPKSGLISDFESGKPEATFGAGWMASTDEMAGGKSVASIGISRPGAVSSSAALAIEGELKPGFAYPWAGGMFSPGASPMQAVDLSQWRALSFFVRGNIPSGQLLIFATHRGRTPLSKGFPITGEWTEVTIPFEEAGLNNRSDVQAFFFGASSQGTFRFEVDNVRFR